VATGFTAGGSAATMGTRVPQWMGQKRCPSAMSYHDVLPAAAGSGCGDIPFVAATP